MEKSPRETSRGTLAQAVLPQAIALFVELGVLEIPLEASGAGTRFARGFLDKLEMTVRVC